MQTMLDATKIRNLHPSELSWANDIYLSIDFVPSSASDFIGVAEANGTRVGLGRVIKVANDVGELGGMYVAPEFRGQSVAPEIVRYLIANCGYPKLFCIPFAHLESLYRGCGFLPVSKSVVVPALVSDKLKWCQTHYVDPVLLLWRNG